MYTVYCGVDLLHAPTLGNKDLLLSSAKLTMEVDIASSFDFTINPTHQNYNNITLGSPIKVFDDNARIFFGLVTDIRRDMYNRKTVHCDGELAFWNKIAVRNYSFSGTITQYLSLLNTSYNNLMNEQQYRFTDPALWIDSATSAITIDRASVSYQSIGDELKEKVVDALGGHVFVQNIIADNHEVMQLNYANGSAPQGDQFITFGKNLIDLSDYLDRSEAYSVIIPLGAETNNVTHERLTIASVNSGSVTLDDATLLSYLGYVEKRVIWDDVNVASILKSKGQAELNRVALGTRTITISAVDLHLLDVNVGALKLGYQYPVVSPKHGLDGNEMFMLSKCRIDLNRPEAGIYTFGATRKTLTGGLTNWQT